MQIFNFRPHVLSDDVKPHSCMSRDPYKIFSYVNCNILSAF